MILSCWLQMNSRRRLALLALSWMLVATSLRAFVLLPQNCSIPTQAEARSAAMAAADWAVENLDSGGRFLYRYDRDERSDVGGYNLVRHIAMTNALYQLVLSGEERYLEDADRSLQFILNLLVDTPEGATFSWPGDVGRVGGTGLLVAALLHRKEATGDTSYDSLAIELGSFIIGQQLPSGALLAYWDLDSGRPVPDRFGIFATGEAFWALSLLDRYFPDREFEEAAFLSADYIATSRDRAEGYNWRSPDHWSAYAFSELASRYTLDESHIEYLRVQAGDFGLMARYESQRTNTAFNQIVRGHQALGAGVGAMGEGLHGLYRVSLADPRLGDLSEGLVAHLGCTVDLLVQRQVVSDDTAANGAWFSDSTTQVDDQQHTLSALLLYAAVLAELEST